MKSFSEKTIKPVLGNKSIGRLLHDGNAVATRAYELGLWLQLMPFCGLPKRPEIITGLNWENQVSGRTGIIMFHAYWARASEGTRDASGGHIDLWNGSRLTISSVIDGISTLGRYAGLHSLRQGAEFLPALAYSDLAGSKLIMFWHIK